MAKSYEEIAKEVIEAIGGKENISSFAHCATRLRIMVVDKDKIDKDKVDNIEKVKGTMFNSGQFQVIFGTGTVNKVYEAVQGLGGVSESSVSDMKKEAAKQGSVIQRISRTFGDIFVPIIPVLVATGLFMGLRGLLTNENLLKLMGTTPESINPNFLMYTQVLTDTAFIILPALVAWSAFKVFGGSPVLGIVLGSMLISSSLPNAYQVASGDAHPIMFFRSKIRTKIKKSYPRCIRFIINAIYCIFSNEYIRIICYWSSISQSRKLYFNWYRMDFKITAWNSRNYNWRTSTINSCNRSASHI